MFNLVADDPVKPKQIQRTESEVSVEGKEIYS